MSVGGLRLGIWTTGGMHYWNQTVIIHSTYIFPLFCLFVRNYHGTITIQTDNFKLIIKSSCSILLIKQNHESNRGHYFPFQAYLLKSNAFVRFYVIFCLIIRLKWGFPNWRALQSIFKYNHIMVLTNRVSFFLFCLCKANYRNLKRRTPTCYQK